MIEENTHVICYFKNNMAIEGMVEIWSDKEVILLSLDGLSKLIVPGGTSDIVFVKIVLRDIKREKMSEVKQEISKRVEEVLQQPEGDLREKNIRQLKSLVDEQDRKIITEKIKEHSLGEKRITKYGTPGFFKKSSTQ